MSRWRRRVVAGASLSAILSACEMSFGLEGLESHSLTVALSGTVTAAPGGAPVAGATVEPTPHESSIGLFGFGVYAESAVTDASGRYALTIQCNLSDGPRCPAIDFVAHLDPSEGALEPHVRTVHARRSGDSVAVATLDFSLRPTRPITVIVHGRVTAGPGGPPIPAASVVVHDRFWPFQQDSTTADSFGAYRIESREYCVLEGGSCTFGALRILAQDGARMQDRELPAVIVPGDSLDVAVSFDDLR